MERNLEKYEIFKDRETILVTEFEEGVKLLIECYNYCNYELNYFGTKKPEQI